MTQTYVKKNFFTIILVVHCSFFKRGYRIYFGKTFSKNEI